MHAVDEGRRAGARDRERARQRSKALFGNLDRLEVAVAVARNEDELVNATDLVSTLDGLQNNRVRAQLIALKDAGLLELAPQLGDGRRVQYIRQPSTFWDACLDLYELWGT